MKRASRPTQHDIARAAGVSTAVVSLVINGRTNGKIKISKATQERVWTAIREQGYVPNLAARQLAGGRTNLIGVFTYEPLFPMTPSDFYQPFLVGIEEQAENSGYNLLLFTRTEADGRRHIYSDGVNQLLATEGAILLGTKEDRAELGRLYRDGFPFVFVGRREIDEGPVAYTAADYAGASADLVRKLLGHGHRHIIYVGRTEEINESALDREQGFLDAMSSAGCAHPATLVHRVDHETIDAARLRAWIAAGATALAVEQMPAALEIWRVAKVSGITIPGDLSLVALGKADDPTVDHQGIDTFFIPHREMGAQAVTLLARMLTEPDAAFPRQLTIPCTPASGRTIGPPPARHPSGKEVA
jgi:DNA-binding LacI/PurR family transcriptional regulator